MNKTDSGIILPGGAPPQNSGPLKIQAMEFTSGGNRYRLNLCLPESFDGAPTSEQTKGLSKELQSVMRLSVLTNLSIAKDLKAAGLKTDFFLEFCRTVGLALIDIDGKMIKVEDELEKS